MLLDPLNIVLLIICFSISVFAIFLGVIYLKKQRYISVIESENLMLKNQIEMQKILEIERENFIKQNQEYMKSAIESISQKALINNNESFLKMAQSSFKELQEKTKLEFDFKQDSFKKMIDPIQQTMDKVNQQITEIEKDRIHSFADLKRHMLDLTQTHKDLRSETHNLVKALRSPNSRGQWGEMQLKRVIEMSGMVAYCDFVQQVSTDDGRLRPDVLVRLPGNKNIVIDAKTPLQAYLEALETSDEDRKQEHLLVHARHIRQHIKQLSQKNYHQQFDNSPEFVVMFIPGESIFSAALTVDPGLIEFGVNEKIILATPTTLIALLRAVAYGWQQETIAENARMIGALGKEFYKRLVDFSAHYSKVGRLLSQSIHAYNESVGTFDKRVMVSARKFQELDPSLIKMDLDMSSYDVQARLSSLVDPEVESVSQE
ncbi:MAG: DNA recombination protein RmuC [Candidatus Puniceispirillum sp.]|nr:DNA recombination protein RmuC [Candidatus Pelagibacter sp.]MBA4283164.1 DNA recombination protein RmuC [Candidatus Puniceispirillum sp.]